MKVLSNKSWLGFVLVCLLAILLRLPALELPIDNDGGARAYHARLILEGEPLYSSHHTGHHLPAIYYTYALAMRLFGDTPRAAHILLLLWTVPTLYLLYRLGMIVADRRVGLLGAGFYALLSSHVWLWGQTAETELFANLPRLTAVYLLILLLQKRTVVWKFLFVGLLAAIAMLYKAVYLSPLALAGILLLIEWWQKKANWTETWQRGFWIISGFILGWLPVLIYFGMLGLLPRLAQVFTLGQAEVAPAVAESGIPTWFWYPVLPLFSLALNNVILLILSLAAFILLCLRRMQPLFYVAIWYVLSFGEAAVNLSPLAHYYLLIVPTLSLLAAWLIVKIYDDVQVISPKAALATLVVVLMLVVGASGWQNGGYYAYYLLYRSGQLDYDEFITLGWPGFGERLLRAEEVARYVVENTTVTDRIFYWSEDVQVYYLANRRSPIDMIWPHEVVATAVAADIFTSQTRYVIMDRYRERDPEPPEWLLAGLAADYELEEVIDGQEIYRRRE